MPIREGRHHRIRIMFTDQSYAEVAVRPHHDDLRLRILGALTPGTPEPPGTLAATTATTPDTLARHPRPMTAAGLIRRTKKTVSITETDLRELTEQTRYIAVASRIIVPQPPHWAARMTAWRPRGTYVSITVAVRHVSATFSVVGGVGDPTVLVGR